jgi:RHS repeat-associated protein
MDAMRLGKMRSASGGWGLRTIPVSRVVGVVVASLVVLAMAPAYAAAEPLCTDTWTGPSEGEWQTASDWSTGKVPSSTDVACIEAGKTVKISEGTYQTGVLLDKGTLVISIRGSLEIVNALEASSAYTLSLTEAGTLTSAGTLDISHSLSWSAESTMSGAGSTVLQSSASGTIANAKLKNRTFVNEGTLTVTSGDLAEIEGAKVENKGTFNVNEGQSDAIVEEGTASLFVNTGTLQKTEETGTAHIEVAFESSGAINGKTGAVAFSSKSTTLGSSVVEGSVIFDGATVTCSGLAGANATVTVSGFPGGSLSVNGSLSRVGTLILKGAGKVTGGGTLGIENSLTWSETAEGKPAMAGTGTTVLEPAASGTVDNGLLAERTFFNDGTLTLPSGDLEEAEGAKFGNNGTFNVNEGQSDAIVVKGTEPLFVNKGVFQRTENGEVTAVVQVEFENYGTVSGNFKFERAIFHKVSTQYGGPHNPSTPGHSCPVCGEPVVVATGDLVESQVDFTIGGRGVGLDLNRTYNSQAAAEGSKGPFGYGWSSSFSDHLVFEKASKEVTLVQANGSTVPFTEGGGETFTPAAWTQDTLSGTESAGYVLTLADQIKYKFAGASGRLESVTDRDGNATTLAYNSEGRLESITDPVGRKIRLKYNSEGLVESAEDPMGHVVKYTYESGNLASVTQPAEASLRWQFKYDGSHQLTEMTDGRGGKTVTEYNEAHQVKKQTDPAGHKLAFEYQQLHTKITNETTGSVTNEYFTTDDEPSSVIRGYESSSATTESFTYNEAGLVLIATDGNGHTTSYEYDSAGDRTSMIDPDKDETKWTYDSKHDIETMTTPKGETTTIKLEGHGNPEVIERAAPGGKTQTTKYKYTAHGELESVTNPLEHTWKYEYDSKGDRTAEVDPEGNKWTWEYNEDSQEIATVSPRGNISEGKPAEFTTKTERNALGRPLTVTDPLKHTTKYKYDGDGNVESITDGNSHTTTYTYNGDNEPIKVKEASGDVTETEYDGAGQVIAQTDGNKHTTKYKRNAVEEVTEVTDPLGHKTLKEYDAAGNMIKLTDPAKRVTTYTYDPANRLTEVSYSSGKPSTVKYEYDKDGDRTKMTDGTGTTTYTYDQLDRLTESENGHKEVIKYEYDLANDQTKITYPNEKSVTRTFDKDGRLEKTTDWLAHATKFTYNEDSDLKTMVFPSETKDEDKYTYNDVDWMTEVKMDKSSEVLASLAYTRDSDGQVKKITSKGLPGAEVTENTYDGSNRLTNYGSTEYKYDAANNPTKEGSVTDTYNEGDELEKGTGVTYSYDELGERTKMTPEKGPATTYGYDQAGDLTSVERPKEGEVAKIEDTYAYNGEGLRTSQTISGTTSYFAWSLTEGIPQLLSDGTNSYIYGPGGVVIEQINNSTGAVGYLHHDQQGSTRLLTGKTGTVEGKCSYGAYGTPTCEGTATSPLGYNGQYTSSDTGLIYLRARVYDPATAQFLAVDPLDKLTLAPYAYANDNPVNESDPAGLFSFEEIVSGVSTVAAVGVCLTPGVDIAACGPAIAANTAVQSALVLASSRSVSEKAGLVLANGVLGAGSVAFSSAAELAAEEGAPGGILSYLRAAGALVPSLPGFLEPEPITGNGCG